MRTEDAIKFYKTASALAQALNITRGAVSQWGESPPLLRQFELEKITRGKLRAEFERQKGAA